MPTTGLEPVRRFRHWSLKPACLPIPARGRTNHARRGIRTLTRLPSQDPESCASANSAIRAQHGAEGSRTPDLLNAIQALSQLSYSPPSRPTMANRHPGIARWPTVRDWPAPVQDPGARRDLLRAAPRLSISSAGLTGLEPATSGVTDRHSNQTELQPPSPQSGRPDSNRRPSAWQADALPTELRPHRSRPCGKSVATPAPAVLHAPTGNRTPITSLKGWRPSR